MRRSVFAAVAGLVAIVLLGFVPNAWTWAPFPFTVPDDAKGYFDADCWYCDSGRRPEEISPREALR